MHVHTKLANIKIQTYTNKSTETEEERDGCAHFCTCTNIKITTRLRLRPRTPCHSRYSSLLFCILSGFWCLSRGSKYNLEL